MTTGPSGLGSRPTVTSYEVGDLVQLVWSGRIRVPHFQRDFRWETEDVLRLFDSIVKGYPLGTLLFAVRKQQTPEDFTLGRLRLTASVHDESLWVVDGQQRLISLANALSPEGHPYRPFTVYYDLAAKEFVEGSKTAVAGAHRIALPVLFDLQKLLGWFRTDGVAASEFFDEAVQVANAVRHYQVPAYLVRQDDREVLTAIFDRLNNSGRRLNRAEIFSALYSGDEHRGEEGPTLTGISDNVAARTGFGSIDDDTVLRALLARRGPDPERDIRYEFPSGEVGDRGPSEFPGEDRFTAFEQTEEALVRTADFLIREAGVPHISLVPYKDQVVLLARYFAHFPHPQPNNLRLLRRLFWRLTLPGPAIFQDGFSRTLGTKIHPGDEEGSLRALLSTVAHTRPAFPGIHPFRANEAATKVVLNAWWSLCPRSLATGEVLDAQSLDALLQQDRTAANATPMIFPRLEDAQRRWWPANRLFLPSGWDPVSELPRALAHRPPHIDEAVWEAALASHLLDRDSAALADRDSGAFLALRQERIRRQLADFVGRMAEWDYEDTPSLDALDLDEEFQDFEETDLPAAPESEG